MSINGIGTVEDAEMTDDGEKVVTMMDVLQEQQEFEDDANAVLGASDANNCTYSKGLIKRQAIYACLTCCPEAKTDPLQRAGVCLACSLTCHEHHDLVELYTKRNFQCDCGNPKFNSHPCQFTPNKTELNEENKYNQNFSGVYCICHRPYPDPKATHEDEMIQCIICEDWLHASHLETSVPPQDQYAEMICKGCMERNEFLHDYSMFAVHTVSEDVDIVIVNGGDTEQDLTNGQVKEEKLDSDIDMGGVYENAHSVNGEGEDNKAKADQDQEEENVTTENNLVVEQTDNKEPQNTDITITGNQNEGSELSENTSNLHMATESSMEESSNEKISETKTTTNDSTIDSSFSNSENIDSAEKPETIVEAEKPENTTEIEKTCENVVEPDTVCLEMTESEKENALLEDPSPKCSQQLPIVSEKEMDLDDVDVKNNVHDSLSIDSVANKSNNEETVEPIENNPTVLESTGSSDMGVESEQKEQERIEGVDISTTTTVSEVNQSVMDNEKDSNEISTSENVPSTEECSVETSSTQEAETSLKEKVVDIPSPKDKNDLPVSEDDNAEEAVKDTTNSNTDVKPEDTSSATVDTTNEVGISEENLIVTNTLSDSHDPNSENKSCEVKVSDNKVETIKQCEDKPENSIPILTSENKRKLSTDIETGTDIATKKTKLDESKLLKCKRPRGVKKVFKGATFWPLSFRQELCTCNECLTMYKDLAVLFLIDPEDTVTAYETLGKERTDGGPSTQYEKGLQALSSLDRIQQINALTEYNKMRDKLLDFLKSFKDRKEIVKEEDIKAFFAGMKPKREPDGVYFCK